MQQTLLYAPFILYGLGFAALFFFWRKAASRWGSWFPLLKKGLEWGLIGAGLADAVYVVMHYKDSDVLAGPAFLLFVAGAALPETILRRVHKPQDGKEETKRGALVGNDIVISKKIKSSKTPTYLKIGGVPIPVNAESYHFLIAGATGTGKSVAINGILQQIRDRGDTAIVVDSGGNFLEKHYNPDTDFVFNPYDSRCVGWSPTAEMQGVWDAQALARSIVPDGVGDSKEWNSYAQTFVGAVLRKLWETERLTLRDFLYYVQAAPRTELQELLADTAAVSQLSSERTFGSIRTIAGNYVTSYDYLPSDKPKFSISEMIQAEHSGVLFMTYRDDQLDSLRNLMACLLDVASRAILSLEPNPNRRVWLIIDEFASIGRVQSIEAVATKARKAGGCLVLGIQSVSQLKDRYGDNGAQTILSCLSTWLVLRCSDSDTAEYMSKYIGEAEISRQQQGLTNSDTGETQSWSEQSSIKRVVLGSQIQAMPNLTGMLKLLGDYPVCEVKLPIPVVRGRGGLPFTARDFKTNPLLKLTPSVPVKASEAPAPAPVAPPEPGVPVQPAVAPAAQYLDKTPRPQKPAQRNVLVEVAQGLIPLHERIARAKAAAPVLPAGGIDPVSPLVRPAPSRAPDASVPPLAAVPEGVPRAAAASPGRPFAPLPVAPVAVFAASPPPPVAAPAEPAGVLSAGTASYLLARLQRTVAQLPAEVPVNLATKSVAVAPPPENAPGPPGVLPVEVPPAAKPRKPQAATAPRVRTLQAETGDKASPAMPLNSAPEAVEPTPKKSEKKKRRSGNTRAMLEGLLR